jgi:hypothetical protein
VIQISSLLFRLNLCLLGVCSVGNKKVEDRFTGYIRVHKKNTAVCSLGLCSSNCLVARIVCLELLCPYVCVP